MLVGPTYLCEAFCTKDMLNHQVRRVLPRRLDDISEDSVFLGREISMTIPARFTL